MESLNIKQKKLLSNVVIIGLGGSGKSIFLYLYNKFKKTRFILISRKFKFKSYRVKIVKKIKTSDIDKNKKYLVINATPLGSDLKKKFIKKSPLKDIILKIINKKSTIYDLVYKPTQTLLKSKCIKNNLNYVGGLKMNTIQGKLALKILEKEKFYVS